MAYPVYPLIKPCPNTHRHNKSAVIHTVAASYLAVSLSVGEGRRQLRRRVRGRLLVEGRWRFLSLRGVSQVVVPLHVAVAGGLVGVPLEGVQRVVHAAAVVGRGLLQEAEGTLHMTSKVGIPLSYMHLVGRILVDILNSFPSQIG